MFTHYVEYYTSQDSALLTKTYANGSKEYGEVLRKVKSLGYQIRNAGRMHSPMFKKLVKNHTPIM